MPIETQTLQQMLDSRGMTIDALLDPGRQYGYGKDTEFGFAFSPFDVGNFEKLLSEFGGYQENLLGDISRQFGGAGQRERATYEDTIRKISEMVRPSGLTGGATERLQAFAAQSGQESYGRLADKFQGSMFKAEEQLGKQYAGIEGLLSSFLTAQPGLALQVKQGDPMSGQLRMTTQDDIQMFLTMPGFENLGRELNAFIGRPYENFVSYTDMVQRMNEMQGGTV